MNFDVLEPGDVIAKFSPDGPLHHAYPIWLFTRLIGPKLAEYMNLETGALVEGHRALEGGWWVMRGGQTFRRPSK